MSAASGWRKVSADGTKEMDADVFVALTKMESPEVGFEAYFEQWAAEERNSFKSFAKSGDALNKESQQPSKPPNHTHTQSTTQQWRCPFAAVIVAVQSD